MGLRRLIESLSDYIVARTVSLKAGSASVFGRGTITRKLTGEVVEFVFGGEPSAEVYSLAAARLAKKLYGPLAGGPFSRMRGAVTHPTAMRQTMGDLVTDALDPGGPGKLVFRTAGDVACATLTFAAAAFGATNGSGVAAAGAIVSDTDAAGGTIAKFTAETAAAVVKFQGAVGTSGSDINLSSLVVGVHDTVAVSSLTYTAPP